MSSNVNAITGEINTEATTLLFGITEVPLSSTGPTSGQALIASGSPLTGTWTTLASGTTFNDSTFNIDNNADATKIMKFNVANVTTGTTRTFSVPDLSDTLVTLSATQTLSNKSLVDNSTNIVNSSDVSKKVKFDNSGITTANTVTLTPPNLTGTYALITNQNPDTSYNYVIGQKLGGLPTLSGTGNTYINTDANTASSGNNNVFIQQRAGGNNTSGLSNICIGYDSGGLNLVGNENTNIGDYAGLRNITTANTNIGYASGMNLTSGGNNCIIGDSSGTSTVGNVSKGSSSLVIVGAASTIADGTSFTNSSAIGYQSTIINSNEVSLGNSSVTSIRSGNTSTCNLGSSSYPFNDVFTKALNNGGVLSVPNATDTLICRNTTDTLTNKSLVDTTNNFVNNSDNTKKALLNLANITTATTRTFSLPDVSDTLVTLSATQTLTNKTISGIPSSVSNADGSLTITPTTGAVVCSLNTNNINSWTSTQRFIGTGILACANIVNNISSPTTYLLGLPNANDTLCGLSATQSLSNKSLIDNSVTFANSSDNTKQVLFNAGNVTTGTTRTMSVPNVSDTLVTLSATQTLSNKSLIDTTSNFLNNSDNSKKALLNLANITTANTRTFSLPDISDTLVTLSATQTLSNKSLIDNSSNFLNNSDNSKKALLNLANITTATTRTYSVPDLSDTLVTLSATQTLTNKVMTGTNNTLTASLLKSATTEVSVSAATAPTNGQVLTATGGSTATWQTPGGSSAYLFGYNSSDSTVSGLGKFGCQGGAGTFLSFPMTTTTTSGFTYSNGLITCNTAGTYYIHSLYNIICNTDNVTCNIMKNPTVYSTGTAGTSNIASTAVVGSGTTWTSAMNAGTIIFANNYFGSIVTATATAITLNNNVQVPAGTAYNIIYSGTEIPGSLATYNSQSVSFQLVNNVIVTLASNDVLVNRLGNPSGNNTCTFTPFTTYPTGSTTKCGFTQSIIPA